MRGKGQHGSIRKFLRMGEAPTVKKKLDIKFCRIHPNFLSWSGYSVIGNRVRLPCIQYLAPGSPIMDDTVEVSLRSEWLIPHVMITSKRKKRQDLIVGSF